jgi:hypothetical protein
MRITRQIQHEQLKLINVFLYIDERLFYYECGSMSDSWLNLPACKLFFDKTAMSLSNKISFTLTVRKKSVIVSWEKWVHTYFFFVIHLQMYSLGYKNIKWNEVHCLFGVLLYCFFYCSFKWKYKLMFLNFLTTKLCSHL